ncbi:MAG: hypothetical protein ACRDMJ_05645, partial [Solirubrobacteraceae bacterium]
MRAALVRGRARAVALVSVVCAIAGWCAGPAFAASSSISVADATAAAEQAVPVDLTFSGTNGQSSSADVEAVVRPAGGLGCQSSYQDDVSAVGG